MGRKRSLSRCAFDHALVDVQGVSIFELYEVDRSGGKLIEVAPSPVSFLIGSNADHPRSLARTQLRRCIGLHADNVIIGEHLLMCDRVR